MSEENKVAELMKPRYKVIADWPGCYIQVGDILTERVVLSKAGWYSQNAKRIHGPEFYPHLFKKLEWWQDRKPEEMPEYVKEIEDGLTHFYKNRTDFKYLSAPHLIGMKRTDDKRMIHLQYLQPATQSDYDQYIKQNL